MFVTAIDDSYCMNLYVCIEETIMYLNNLKIALFLDTQKIHSFFDNLINLAKKKYSRNNLLYSLNFANLSQQNYVIIDCKAPPPPITLII